MRLQDRARQFNQNFDRRTIVYYMRKADRTPYGVVVGVVNDDNTLSVGYHSVKRSEPFNKHIGRFIATNRALSYNNTNAPGYNKMVERWERCLNYQKGLKGYNDVTLYQDMNSISW